MLRQLADGIEDAKVAWIDGRRTGDEDATFEVDDFVGLLGESEAGVDLIRFESAILVWNADEDVRIGYRNASALLEVAQAAGADDLEGATEERLLVQNAVYKTGQGCEGADETANGIRSARAR